MFMYLIISSLHSTEAFSTTIFNKLTGTLFKVSLLYVYCKSFQSYTHGNTHREIIEMFHVWIVSSLFWFYTET